ncbi:unnamed protein product [Cuscuta campestris]|uniref:Uncharacterized protein n=1 Tax=Cuscuta campestris TaxID=132261 RepID=A0A484K224_9ASTE|nr:unnamed protein product [Cuscuta campestris]
MCELSLVEEEAGGCALDIDPKKEVQVTHVCHGEFSLKLLNEALKPCRGGCPSTLSGGGAIAIIDAKKPIPTAAVRRAAAVIAAVLVADAGIPTCQQRRAAGSAQWSPLPIEKEKGRPYLEKTRHGGRSFDGGAKLMLELHGSSMLIVVKQLMNHRPEGRCSSDRRENEIRHLICDGGENPSLEDNIKLKPFVVVVGDGSNRAFEIAMEIELPCKKEEQAAPLFIVWLRKTELNWNMKFDI